MNCATINLVYVREMSDSNTLMISRALEFSQLMRIAEGMSYKHETMFIKARGKQIQRAVEVCTMLQARGRGNPVKIETGYEQMDLHVPSIDIELKCN